MDIKHVNITVSGKVQGVFFRASAKEKAIELRIKGFVRNEPDNRVYIEAEADDSSLQQLIQWCRHGPPRAEVDKVNVENGRVLMFSSFEIRRLI